MNKIDGRVHNQVADLLSAYIDGQVTAGQRRQVEQHLAVCPVCARNLMTMRETVRLLGELPVLAAPRPFTLRQQQARPARPSAWRWVFGLPGLATGVAVLLCTVAVGSLTLLGRVAPGGVLPVAMAPTAPGAPSTRQEAKADREAATAARPWSPEATANATAAAAEARTAPAVGPSDEMEAAGRSPMPTVQALATSDEHEAPAATPTAPATSTVPVAVTRVPDSFARDVAEGAAPTAPLSEESDAVHQKVPSGAVQATPTALPTRSIAPKSAAATATSAPSRAALGEAAPTSQPEAPPAPALAPAEDQPATPQEPPLPADQEDLMRQRAGETVAPNLMAVEALQLQVEPGIIHVSGRLPLPEGQLIVAELYKEQEPVDWAVPDTLRSQVKAEGRFELEMKARPGIPDADLLGVAPAQYEIRITPVEPEEPIEARIPFDTYPPPRSQ